jgi:hypothetical protein
LDPADAAVKPRFTALLTSSVLEGCRTGWRVGGPLGASESSIIKLTITSNAVAVVEDDVIDYQQSRFDACQPARKALS